jgi:hypothetical protein
MVAVLLDSQSGVCASCGSHRSKFRLSLLTSCRIMTQLLSNLSSPSLNREVKPDILHVFGDMAQGLGANFDRYISQVVETLQAAMNIAYSNQMTYRDDADPDEALILYNNELRGAIVQSSQGAAYTPLCFTTYTVYLYKVDLQVGVGPARRIVNQCTHVEQIAFACVNRLFELEISCFSVNCSHSDLTAGILLSLPKNAADIPTMTSQLITPFGRHLLQFVNLIYSDKDFADDILVKESIRLLGDLCKVPQLSHEIVDASNKQWISDFLQTSSDVPQHIQAGTQEQLRRIGFA